MCLSAAIWMVTVHPASSQVVLSRAPTITIGQIEPLALKEAAADLASEMRSVFGAPVRVVHNQSDAAACAIVIASNAFRSQRDASEASTPEILQIQVLNTDSKQQAVLLTGSDMRGAIYAVYQFSRQFLGVDPMYYWTDVSPARKDQVIVPAGFYLEDGPPTFTHRGFFINDTDLLTGWRPGAKDGADISLAEAEPRWKRVQALAQEADPLISPQGQELFQEHVLTQLGVQRNGNLMLLEICRTARSQVPAERLAHVERAITYIQAALQSLHDAEFGKWIGFYRGDLMVDVRQSLALAEGYRDLLQGKPLPKDLVVAQHPVLPYDMIEAYQGQRIVPM